MISERISEFSRAAYAKGRQLVFETPIEVAIGAALGLAAFATHSYQHESGKLGQIPLAFSEIGQTKRELGWRGMETPPLTLAYSAINDTTMQVFEANNLGYVWEVGKPFTRTERIGYEIEKKVEPTLRIHTQITDYAAQFPDIARHALASLEPATSASEDIKPVIAAFREVWDEDHDDEYRTEIYTEEECSGTGENRSCHMAVKTRQVYDHTDHTYIYHRQEGLRAARLLNDFMARHPDIRIPEQLILVPKTNAENEWAMRESRRRLPDYEGLYEEDYMRLTNVWATGSNYNVLMPKAYEAHGQLGALRPQWDAAKSTARSTEYSTYSHSDPGPREYQVAMAVLRQAAEMADNIDRTSGGIEYARDTITPMTEKIIEFVNVTQHYQEGNANQLRREVMHMAREMYKRNFSDGFDTEPAKWGMVALWGFLGLLGGAAVGYGAHIGIDRSKAAAEYFREKRGNRFGGRGNRDFY